MKKWMRIVAMALAMMVVVMCMVGCKKKEEPVEEDQQEVTATPEATPEATPVPTPTPEPKLVECGFTFKIMDEVMFTTANLNVRSLPNTDGSKIGMFHKGAEVQVSGQCEETGWYRVDYDGQIGYVSNEYME